MADGIADTAAGNERVKIKIKIRKKPSVSVGSKEIDRISVLQIETHALAPVTMSMGRARCLLPMVVDGKLAVRKNGMV